MDDYASLIDRAPAISPDASGASVYDRFEREAEVLVIAVVDDDQRPIGLVDRSGFGLKMAAEHGRALYAGRPISAVMETDFLVVDHRTSAAEFCRQVLAGRGADLLRGFVVVREGRYLGVGTALSLLQAVVAQPDSRLADATAAAERMARAENEAHAATRAKGQFLAVMSHEIRTPMNGVLAVAELLQRQPLSEDASAYVQTIIDSSESLLRLLSDAIDLSRADAGGMDLAAEPTLLRALMDDVQALWLPRAHQDRVNLNVSFVGGADAAVLVDGVRLKQVFNNLIGNALKFTRRGGVEASLYAAPGRDGRLRLLGKVRDTGPGIAADKLDRIFEPFAQDERGVQSGGAGLGLAICRQIVHAMDGRVWAESNPGSGATFLFEVEAPAVAAPRELLADGTQNESRSLGAHVLIVDDNATNRMVAETLVEMFGCTSESVCDGVEAVEAARQGRFDAILMDIKMPRMDGVQATLAIRALGGPASEIPIIALTANADPEDARAYVASGMACVVEKPIKAERLLTALAEALAPRVDEPLAEATAA